jgi:hypothetical protein
MWRIIDTRLGEDGMEIVWLCTRVWRGAIVTYYGILTHVSILPDNEILLLILARVDHVPHARHSERRLGDVGGEDAFPCSPESGGEDAVLL